MAEIDFLKSRMAGKGVELAQQEGIIGSKGPGETAKEMLKQHLESKYNRARKKLKSLTKTRETQRKRRLESKLPLISLVGYTNAGKSSLLNLITKSDVLVEDKLFATLDTTTRELFIDGKKFGLISDTVGFISQLPHHLVEAFKSTLDELKYSSLLLHIIDASNQNWPNQVKTVKQTLKDLQLKQNIINVFNKTDKLNEFELELLKEETIDLSPRIFINTTSKNGIIELVKFLNQYKFK